MNKAQAYSSPLAVPPRVLIVDDSPDFRMLARQFILVEWPDANVADLDPLHQHKPDHRFDWTQYDVVLLDYLLGEEDGLEWLKDFKLMSHIPPVVFLTGSGSEEVAVRALKLGAADYLRKHDLSRARLVKAISESIAGHAQLEARRQMLATMSRTMPGFGESTVPNNEAGAFPTSRRKDGAVTLILINGYRVLRKIGNGGMSTVYLAERVDNNQKTVLKILDAELGKNREFLKRFIQEYGIISKLQSPYVVKIHDQGFTEEHVYIAMEYFPGGDLKAKIDQGMFALDALQVLSQIAKALQAIHAAGVVHRDLKPQNIMFRADGTLAILDFGIAKVVAEQNDLTEHGQVLGTPYYMSPEQGTGKAVDGRSDIYSAGVILYEMLTGKRLFAADNAVSLVYKHIHDEIPHLPAALALYTPLLSRLVAKNPEHRFQDGLSLAQYLRDQFAIR
jgi:eukaryotic-like serine/threonine-protein kinase